jgi:hypothetical protein
MSSSYTRSNETDSYQILSSYDNSTNQAEVAAVSALVKGNLGDASGNILVSSANESEWVYSMLDPSFVDTSALANYPSGSVTKNSVILTQFVEPSAFQSYETSLSNVGDTETNNFTFAMLETSSAFYDCNYVVTQSHLHNHFDNAVSPDGSTPEGAKVEVNFDEENSNHHAHRAINCSWNTIKSPYSGLTAGANPIAVTQDVEFNVDSSLGQEGTVIEGDYVSKWGQSSNVDGSITFTNISSGYQPISNNLLVDARTDFEGFNTTDDVGIYRIQHNMDGAVKTNVILESADPTVATPYLVAMPLMDANADAGAIVPGSLKSDLNVPGTMVINDFYSLFNAAVADTVADGFTFQIDVADDTAGYTVELTDTNVPNERNQMIDALDNSNLLDNPYYMANNVAQDHTIEFSDAGLTIVSATNGVNATAESVSIDLINGETLTSTYAGVDGQIKVVPHISNARATSVVIEDMARTSASDVNVWYANDADVGSRSTLSNEMMTNPYLYVFNGKVALRSSEEPAEHVFKSDNGAFLTLYTTEIVNNSFDTAITNLNFNSSAFDDDSVRLWRISAQNSLIAEPESFYAGYDNTENAGIDLVGGISVQSVMQNLIGNLTAYSSYRCTLTAKQLSDINLTAAVDDESNWEINYSGEGDSFLHSSSDIAFNNSSSLPLNDAVLIASINNGANLYYKYEYKTRTISSTYGGLQDYVEVSYSTDPDLVDATVFSIPQPELTRSYSETPVTVTSTDISPSLYSFSTGIYSSEHWKLVRLVKQTTFSVSFLPKYGPFSNIILTVNGVIQTDTYYALKNKSTGQIAPHSALQYIIADSSLTDFNKVVESLGVESGSTSISGVFGAADLKAFKAIIEGKQTSDDNWVTISDTIDFDAYYALNNVHELTIEDPTSTTPDVTTVCEYAPFTDMVQSSILLQLNGEHYYIPFLYDPRSTTYSLSSFTSSPDGLFETTDLALPNLASSNFSVVNNYNCTNESSWVSNDYSLFVDVVDEIITMTVKDASDVEIMVITKPANDVFLGTFVITYISNDIWHVYTRVGASVSDNLLDESFQSTTYPDDFTEFVDGIQVNVGSTVDLVGCSIAFRVLADFVTINAVGTVADPTSSNELGISSYNNGSLLFQFIDTNSANFSAKFTFDKYRGYPAINPANADMVQVYTISRDSTVVDFIVNDGELSQQLTSNMYFGQQLNVNNLINADEVTCANLGLKFNALYSLHPTGASLAYPVTVRGDSVVVTITNSGYTGSATNIPVPTNATSVVNPLSYNFETNLKTFGRDNMYTFSGLFSETEQLVAIRPSRVKLQNTAFNYSSFSYQIQLVVPPLKIYKAVPTQENGVNYLGNPALVSGNDPSVNPSINVWALFATLTTYTDRLAGINIGRKLIKQNPELLETHSVSFFTSVPPQQMFETISSAGSPQLPYDWETENVENRVVTYLPQMDELAVFNPFAASISRSDVNGNDCTIEHDATIINDLTFTLLQTPVVLDLVDDADSTRYGIIVAGINLDIKLYTGLYDSDLKEHIIYNGPSTSIPSELDVLTNKIVLRSRENDGSIKFSMVQDPTDLGYASGLEGYVDVFRTTEQSTYYNMDFNIGNPSWFNNNDPITYFNGYADGIRPTLYTVVDMNDTSTRRNFRRVYKYTSGSTFDFQSLPELQTFALTFAQGRQYFDTTVEAFGFPSQAGEIADYATQLEQTNIGEISWTDDEDFSADVAVSWAFGNSFTANNMSVDLFSVDANKVKWSFLTLTPFQSFINQFGLTVSEVSWDGSVYAPMVSTQVVKISPQLSNPPLNGNNSTIEQYSTSTLQA